MDNQLLAQSSSNQSKLIKATEINFDELNEFSNTSQDQVNVWVKPGSNELLIDLSAYEGVQTTFEIISYQGNPIMKQDLGVVTWGYYQVKLEASLEGLHLIYLNGNGIREQVRVWLNKPLHHIQEEK